MVVLIAGVSYVGYIAIKWVGRSRGLMVTSLFGGMVSSTAVTISFARRVRHRPDEHDICAAGIAAASSIMFPRMLLVLAVVAPAMALELSVPLLAAGAGGLIGAAVLMRRSSRTHSRPDDETAQHQNPLDLGTALQFGAFLAAIFLLANAAQAWLGDAGLLTLAVVSGLGDVDAIVLSFSDMAGEGSVAIALAGTGILLAALSNTVVKCGLATGIGGWRLGLRVAVALTMALAAGGGAVAIVPPG
jgi:uncharacterized membrane protein (DUF4010 family)